MGASARSEKSVGDRPGIRTAAAGNKEDIVMGFGALPPEVNSARMCGGAGSGPLVAAASAWDGVATELKPLQSCASPPRPALEVLRDELTGGRLSGQKFVVGHRLVLS